MNPKIPIVLKKPKGKILAHQFLEQARSELVKALLEETDMLDDFEVTCEDGQRITIRHLHEFLIPAIECLKQLASERGEKPFYRQPPPPGVKGADGKW